MTTEISKTVAPINHLAKQDGKKKSAFSVNSNDSLISIASSKKGFHAYLWQPTICAVNVNDDRKKLPEKIVRTLPKLIKDLTSIRNRENKSVIRLSSLRKTIITSIALFEQKRIQYQQVHQQIRERKSLQQQQQQQQQQQSKQQPQQQTQQQSQPESQQLQSQLKSQSLPQPQLELFEDEQFPTNRSSLYLQTDKPDPMYDSLIFKWLRIAFIKFDALPPEGDVFGAMEIKSLSESRIKIGATPATPIDSAALSVTGGAGGESRLTGRTISSMLDEEQLRKSPEIIRLLSAKYGLCVRNSKSIGVEHFRQGKLGNCWMICALACLMWHHAHHLANIIPNASLQPDGMYQIFFCLDGQWTAIEIDDQFPVDVDRRLVFAQPLANQLYAPLMEKALAKYYSSYKALNQGTVLEGFSTLTGMPLERVIISTNYNNNNNNGRHQNKLWSRLQNCLAKQHYMIAGCCAKGIMGLFEDHAYSILDSMASLDVRALLLWNPWGKQELHGKLREANDAIHCKLPLHRLCPGMFWMRFADFVETFDYVDICKYDCDWHCKRFRFRLPRGFRRHDHFTMFEFEIPESSVVDDSDSDDSRWCRFEFTVYQEVIRDIKLQTKLEISIIIGMRSTEGDTIQFVWKSSTLVNKVGSVGKDLPPGKYLLTVVSFNHMGSSSRLKEEPQLVIAFHAARPFKVCPLQCDISLLGDLIISMAIKIGAPNECAEQCWTEYVIRDEFCAFVSVLENRNTHKDGDDNSTTTTTTTTTNNNNNNNNNKYNFKRSVIAWNDTRSSEHCSSLRSSRRTIDIVPPRTRQILVLMIRESDKLKFQYKKQSELCRADAPSLQFDLSQLALHPDVCKIAAIFAPRRITADTQPPPMLVSPKKKQIEKLKIAKDADDSEDGGGEKMETTTSTMSSSDSSTINDRSSLINQRSKNRYRCPNCCCCCSIA